MKFENQYHPGIQVASMPIKHSVGLFISLATTVIFLWGVSFAIYYVTAALLAGAGVYLGMKRYRRVHPPDPPLHVYLG